MGRRVTVRPVPYMKQPRRLKPRKWTATVISERKISVEAATEKRAEEELKRKLEPGERIIAVQISLL